MNYYHIGIIALLFGTGELILGLGTHGQLFISMMAMVLCSYVVSFTCLLLHEEEETVILTWKHSIPNGK